MSTVISAVLPVFLLIIIGNVSRRTGFLNDEFWRQAERFTYFVLFPCLLIPKLANTSFESFDTALFIIAGIIMVLIGVVLSYLLYPLLKMNGPDFTSFFQGNIRFNTYIGLAIVTVMLPDPALSMTALLLAVIIPAVNLFCVLIFNIHTDQAFTTKRVLKTLFNNPLIMACFAGILLNLLGIRISGIPFDIVDKLGQMALPMGLLAVGASVKLKALKQSSSIFIWSSLIKLLVMPFAAYFALNWIGLSKESVAVFIIFAALPTAASAFLLAKQLGGNAPLMAAIITGQTLLSLVTLPIVLGVMVAFG